MTASRRVVGVAALAFALAAPAPARDDRSGTIKADDYSAVDAVAEREMRANNVPGAAIAVVKEDRVVYAKGYGVLNVETNVPVTPDTLFRMGSTTKMFTAAALAIQADDGRLALDAPVGTYVKGLDPAIARLTCDQLLSHRGGLRDMAPPYVSSDETSLGAANRTWKGDAFFAEPGEIYSYTSLGYWLAGLVVEEVDKTPYADAMRERVFDPLGMKRTTFRPLVAMTYPLAVGHATGEDAKAAVVRPAANNTVQWPAGSMYSSVTELARFATAFVNGGKLDGKQAIPARVVERLSAEHAKIPGGEEADYGYGYGLTRYRHRGVRVLEHGGASRGYGSNIRFLPDQRVAVIVLTNSSGQSLGETVERATEIAVRLEPESAPVAPAPLPVSPAEIADLIGVYANEPMAWEITARDGKLFVDVKHEKAQFPLVKVGERRFVYGTSNENEFAFVRDARGRTAYLFSFLYAARKRSPNATSAP